MKSPKFNFNLEDKVAIIVGGANGLGTTLGLEFANQGSQVVVLDIQQNPSLNFKAEVYQCDASNFTEVQNALQSILDKFEQIDILVNCIRLKKNSINQINEIESWNQGLKINLNTYFNTSFAFCELLKKNQKNGSIINISSVTSSLINLNESISYHCSKAAIDQMTRYFAVKYGPHQIRINSVLPGLVSHSFSEPSNTAKNSSFYSKLASYIPLRRSGAPQELASAVLFFASDAASFITGQAIALDGGLSICEQHGLLPSHLFE